MKRFSVIPALLLGLFLLIPVNGDACDYDLKVFNHRLQENHLRIYMEVKTSVVNALTDDLMDADSFDTRHSMGDSTITDIGNYGERGNGLSTVLMIDRSTLPGEYPAKVREAALDYVNSKEEHDEIALLFFAQEAHPHGFNKDKATLKTIINAEIRGKRPRPQQPNRITQLYKFLMDAITQADENGKCELRLVLVVTDGDEEVYAITPEQIIARAREKRVGIFAIGLKTGDNFAELQKLKQIAEGSGGEYVGVDASTPLGPLFQYARDRANNFVVIDEDLCGIKRSEASAGKYDIQVTYEDCESNTYPLALNVLEQDLSECAECRNDDNCKANQWCHKADPKDPGGVCETVQCKGCEEKVVNHKAVKKECRQNSDCGRKGSDCRCVDGFCNRRIDCDRNWKKYNEESKKCERMSCGDDKPCPHDDEEAAECVDGKCDMIRECGPCQEKGESNRCDFVECKHDCVCQEGCLCLEGSCFSSDEPGADKRPKCKDGKMPLNGKCQEVECTQDEDCNPDCNKEGVLCSKSCEDQESVCAPRIGTDEDEESTCQLLFDDPLSEKCEEEIDDKWRPIRCDKDADCPKGCDCDDKTGECKDGRVFGKLPTWALVLIGLAIVALVLLVLALKKKTPPPPPPLPTPPVGGDRQATEFGGSGGPAGGGGHIPGGSGTAFEEPPPATGGGGGSPETAFDERLDSEYTLVIRSETGTERKRIPANGAVIGRESTDADIVIPLKIVSSRHLRIEFSGGRIYVIPFESLNPTFYGGMELRAGSRTEVGVNQTIMIGASIELVIEGPPTGGGRPKSATVIDR